MSGKRALAVALAVAGIVAAGSPASADELEDYLEHAAEAEYAGRRVVVTMWGDRSVAAVTDVEHSSNIFMIGAGGTEAVIIEGMAMQAPGDGVALARWSPPAVSERYEVGAVNEVTQLGRAARAIDILEGDRLRARIIFDGATWAPLVTEIYDGDGQLFRVASYTALDPHPRRISEQLQTRGYDFDLVDRLDASTLPETAAGYQRADMYADGNGVTQAFYSDGLFSFSVFEVAPGQVKDTFGGASTMQVDGGEYWVIVRPSELWVAWEHGTIAYVLVGDLPPDHLNDVLSALPEQKRRSWLDRILGIFG